MKPENEIDLLKPPHLLPEPIQALLKEFQLEENTYEVCTALEEALEKHGYTFEWGLDAEPFNLTYITKVNK